jgi:hypothetical protein
MGAVPLERVFSFQFKKPDLISAGPGLVPGNVYVDHLVALDRVPARVRDQILVEIDPILVGLW